MSSEPVAASPSRPTQSSPVQSVFLHRQVESLSDAEGGDTRPGPYQDSRSLLSVTYQNVGFSFTSIFPKLLYNLLILYQLNISCVALAWLAKVRADQLFKHPLIVKNVCVLMIFQNVAFDSCLL